MLMNFFAYLRESRKKLALFRSTRRQEEQNVWDSFSDTRISFCSAGDVCSLKTERGITVEYEEPFLPLWINLRLAKTGFLVFLKIIQIRFQTLTLQREVQRLLWKVQKSSSQVLFGLVLFWFAFDLLSRGTQNRTQNRHLSLPPIEFVNCLFFVSLLWSKHNVIWESSGQGNVSWQCWPKICKNFEGERA